MEKALAVIGAYFKEDEVVFMDHVHTQVLQFEESEKYELSKIRL